MAQLETGHIMKRFTVIDFLGMLVPGGLVLLAWNYYFGGVVDPVRRFFGEQPLAIAAYFVLAGYLLGMVLQEISAPLKDMWEKPLSKIDREKQHESQVWACYQMCFGRTTEHPPEQEKEIKAVGDAIYHHVSVNEVPGSKRTLYHAFSTMGRSTCVAALLIAGMAVLAWVWNRPESDNPFIMGAVCLFIAVIMYRRGRRFYLEVQKCAYREFVQMEKGKAESSSVGQP